MQEQSSLITSSYNIKFLHIHSSSNDCLQPKLIQNILQQIGYILGNKRCILFVDCCFYDLFSNDMKDDEDDGIKNVNKLHSSLGLILVAKEVS